MTPPFEGNRAGVQRTAVAALIATLAALALDHALVVARVAENWTRDVRVATLAPRLPTSRDVVVVAIDEHTVADLPYRSPIDRALLAELVTSLAARGARAIGVDLLVDGPSEPAKDERLRAALHALDVPVVMAWAARADGLTQAQSTWLDAFLTGVRRGAARALSDPADGVVRAVPTMTPGSSDPPGLAAALAAATGVAVPPGPLLTLDYRRGAGEDGVLVPVYPAHVAALLPRDWIEGRVVLVGVDLALADRHRTPLSVLEGREVAGVTIHAQAFAQLADGRSLAVGGAGTRIAMVAAAALAGAGIATLPGSFSVVVAASLGAIAALWLGGFGLFRIGGPLVPLVAPSLALGIATGSAALARLRAEQATRRFVQRAFTKYLAPEVVERLVRQPERLAVGGERRFITFMFTDVADFTALVEDMEPAPLVELLNEYLDGACRLVMQHGGTIDKVVGDALHVMFNAPQDQDDHRARAIRCAVALDAFSRAFVERQRAWGIDFGMTRIGVHTGPAVVGNFGGAERFDYTAHGDAINTAARLESANKHLGTRVLISAASAGDTTEPSLRPVGTLMLKGKRIGVDVYEPLAAAGAGQAPVDAYLEAYARLEAETPIAAEAFAGLARRCPGDSLVAFHARRLALGETGTRIIMPGK